MEEIIFDVIRLLVVLICAVVTRYLIPFLKSKDETEKLEDVITWVKTSVLAAEQTVTGTNQGNEKKAIVTKFIKEILTAKKITLSDEQISKLIEAAVKTMNDAKK